MISDGILACFSFFFYAEEPAPPGNTSVRNYIVQTVASPKIKEEKVPLFAIHSHTQSNRAGDQASSLELLDGLRFILNRCKENTDSGHKHCELSYFFI